ncbi:MAG: SUMF1/EgtB/PvdO family nonheme iron enzyme [Spirochaeta sp.]|jgi:formylglycine-generating enzyme required for sulfatase activity|nr:SUMF1/EgtB/PvdO family nonheme iron enzyme [Spirochaeta sp.]
MAPPWKRVENEAEIDELTVTLSPVFGVPPERYVPGLFAAAIVVALFFLFVFPGLRSYGTEMTVNSAPAGGSVYLDGTRIGSAPLTVFVPSGRYDVEVRFPGLRPFAAEVELGGRRIGSLFFPRRHTVNAVVGPETVQSELDQLMSEYSAWSLSGPPGEQFQYPPVGRIIGRALWAGNPPDDLRTRTTHALISATTEAQVPDLLGGLLRMTAPGGVVLPHTMQQLVHEFVRIDNGSPLFSVAVQIISAAAPDQIETARVISDSRWSDARYEALSTELLAASLELDEGRIPERVSVPVEGMDFVRVPAGNYIVGYPSRSENEPGIPVSFSEPFLLLAHEVTRTEFARFLVAQPQWSPERRSDLVAEGVADASYLSDWPENWRDMTAPGAAGNETFGSEPVRYVSWHAAHAYAGWLDKELDAPGRVVLPGAVAWEYAAFLNALGPAEAVFGTDGPVPAQSGAAGALGLRHMMGNLWEWTDDWYTEHGRIIPAPVAAQKTVIGGSYANEPTARPITGAQPPQWATPFLGFRVAIYPDGDDSDE